MAFPKKLYPREKEVKSQGVDEAADATVTRQEFNDLQLRFRLLLKAYVLAGMPMPNQLEEEFTKAVELTA